MKFACDRFVRIKLTAIVKDIGLNIEQHWYKIFLAEIVSFKYVHENLRNHHLTSFVY